MLSLANFSSSGREEGEKKKKKSLLGQELLSSKQGKMNSLLESSRTFLNPHLQRVLGLLLSVPTSSARPFKGALPARSGKPPHERRAPPGRGDDTHTRCPCPPQPGDLSGSDRRERFLRSSDCRKPVPRKDTRINGSCSRPRELPLPAARASALPPARTQAARAARRSEQGLARLSPASSAYRKTKQEGSRPALAINSF